jgi:hypothetical protein
MKKIITIVLALCFGLSITFAADKKAEAPVNDKCPISGKAVDSEQVVQLGVCCGNCAKKVAKDAKAAVEKAKGDFKTCPFSGKPAKKFVSVAFCCSNCKGKASAKG